MSASLFNFSFTVTPWHLGHGTPARWQSGYAAACKAVDVGSIPARASSILAPQSF